MRILFLSTACIALSACLMGTTGCGDAGENATDKDVEVEIHKTPDLNPQTDDDVDVKVEEERAVNPEVEG